MINSEYSWEFEVWKEINYYLLNTPKIIQTIKSFITLIEED